MLPDVLHRRMRWVALRNLRSIKFLSPRSRQSQSRDLLELIPLIMLISARKMYTDIFVSV